MGSLDDLLQESSFGESVDATEGSSVAPHHRRNLSSAVTEILDRVDLIGELAFFCWLGTFGNVDLVEIVKKSFDPFVDAGFLSVCRFVVGIDESIELSRSSCDLLESSSGTRINF